MTIHHPSTTHKSAWFASLPTWCSSLPKRIVAVIDSIRLLFIMLDARLRTVATEPDRGAATAEYAIVLIAATGFAALLVTILKSETIKGLLLAIVKKALNVG